MPTQKIKTIAAAVVIIGIYLVVIYILAREQADKRANLYECPLCGQLVK